MPDWSSSMQQSFEYYTVDPGTWKDVKRLDNVKSCTINRDSEVETLGSATIDITESVGESYIRIYLVTLQNGLTERHPLGTFLVQTPKSSFDGKIREVSMDAYTPLLELKENPPPIGYTILKNAKIMTIAGVLVRDNTRAPCIPTECSERLQTNFVADPNDTWLSYITSFIARAKYELSLDEHGRILFSPKQDAASLQPVCTFDDSNSSILYPEISIDHDLFNIPNVVEVVYSSGSDTYYGVAVNNDSNSPTSTINRGRKITQRITNPDFAGIPSELHIQQYAEQVLKDLSTVEYTVTYKHAYRPVRLGDCVRLNYEGAGIVNVKAKVISQSIKCEPGCPVTEKAVFTTKLWG